MIYGDALPRPALADSLQSGLSHEGLSAPAETVWQGPQARHVKAQGEARRAQPWVGGNENYSPACKAGTFRHRDDVVDWVPALQAG
jgi:hypothetical protein